MEKKEYKINAWLTKGIPAEEFEAEKVMAVIGAKINLRRQELNLDQKAFAKLAGVSQGMVSRWESGTYNFSVATLAMICCKLGVKLEVKMESTEQKQEEIVFLSNVSQATGWCDWKPNKEDIIMGGAAC